MTIGKQTIRGSISSLRIVVMICMALVGGGIPIAQAAPRAQAEPLSDEALANATYPTDVVPEGRVQLQDGVYEDPATHMRVELAENPRATGDVNEDGDPDSAVILIANSAGSGVFSLMSVVLNEGGIASPADTVFLGDRVIPIALSIRDGEIRVTFLDRRADQPMTARPTIPVVMRYRFSGGQLVATGPLSPAAVNNTEYPLEDAPGGTAVFTNGRYENPEAHIVATIAPAPRGLGDLDGDGSMDSAVLIHETSGAGGERSILAAVLNQDYAAIPVSTITIGDRVRVTRISVTDGVITVDYLDRRPGQPMSARPTVRTSKRFVLTDNQLTAAPTVAGVLANDPRFSTLTAAIQTAGLTETLNAAGPLTVLAPTNDAFTKLDQETWDAITQNDIGLLRDVVLYHVFRGRFNERNAIGMNGAQSLLPGAKPQVRLDDSGLTVDGRATVTEYDIPGENGVIHAVNSVLLPPMPILQRLALDGRFKSLVTAIRTAGLAEELDSNADSFTLFAPTDEAFANLSQTPGYLDQLLANPEQLKTLLSYHIVPRQLSAAQVAEQTQLDTQMEDRALTITAQDGEVMINNARVIEPDMRTLGGVVHGIDRVLGTAVALPPATIAPGVPTTPSGVLTGTVYYLERIALSPDAVIEVQLEDVSRMDVAATILASQTITVGENQVPFPFELQYDPAQIMPTGRYGVRARILIDGQMQWTNTENAVPVLTQGNPATGIDVRVSPVGSREQAAAEEAVQEEVMNLSGVLTGSVYYLERIALPPGAVIEVKLEDVSLMDVAATILASQTMTVGEQQVPFPFELHYDPAQIMANGRYALRARILFGGQLRWINTQNVPVLTQGSPTTDVRIRVSPAGAREQAAARVPISLSGMLSGTVFYLERIALSPGAVIEVQLEDMPRTDIAPTVLASQTITVGEQQPPILFELKYDPAQIRADNRYGVRARILIDGLVRWINTENVAVPVLTQGNPTTGVGIRVSPASSQ